MSPLNLLLSISDASRFKILPYCSSERFLQIVEQCRPNANKLDGGNLKVAQSNLKISRVF